jgi:hypothetical protein
LPFCYTVTQTKIKRAVANALKKLILDYVQKTTEPAQSKDENYCTDGGSLISTPQHQHHCDANISDGSSYSSVRNM